MRLISPNRPGYGDSTMVRTPSLLAAGRDSAALAEALELHEYAVMGISGGGPFAVASAVCDRARVRALAVVGGVGPWRELDPATENIESRAHLELLDAGDLDGAWAGFRREIEEDLAGLRGLDDDARVDAFLGESGSSTSDLIGNSEYRALWASNIALILANPEGWAYDSLCWGGRWDVDPRDIAAPTTVWDTDVDGAPHATWYAEHISGAELFLFTGESHVDACDSHWPEVLDGLRNKWT
jgi:pimeloyl-ACP methyl ester carboxylesterase